MDMVRVQSEQSVAESPDKRLVHWLLKGDDGTQNARTLKIRAIRQRQR